MATKRRGKTNKEPGVTMYAAIGGLYVSLSQQVVRLSLRQRARTIQAQTLEDAPVAREGDKPFGRAYLCTSTIHM